MDDLQLIGEDIVTARARVMCELSDALDLAEDDVAKETLRYTMRSVSNSIKQLVVPENTPSRLH